MSAKAGTWGSGPPYGCRLADARPHPNKARRLGRRAYRFEPDPDTAQVVRWIFAQRRSARGSSPRSSSRWPPAASATSCRDGGDLPAQAFLTLFGFPLDMRDQLIEWKDAVLGLTDASGNTALDGEEALTDEEAIGLCFLFVLAGLDTVTGSLRFGLDRLARNPVQRREIVDDPSLIPAAVEELVRLDPPAPFAPRVTTEETVLDGRTLPGHRIPDYAVAPGAVSRVRWPQGTLGLEALPLVFPRLAG